MFAIWEGNKSFLIIWEGNKSFLIIWEGNKIFCCRYAHQLVYDETRLRDSKYQMICTKEVKD